MGEVTSEPAPVAGVVQSESRDLLKFYPLLRVRRIRRRRFELVRIDAAGISVWYLPHPWFESDWPADADAPPRQADWAAVWADIQQVSTQRVTVKKVEHWTDACCSGL